MLSIHYDSNLSAGAQTVTGTYVIIMIVYRRLLTTAKQLNNNYACLQALVNNSKLTWQSSCVIAINAQKTAKAICPTL